MPASECPMTTGPFERVWKAAEKFASDGIPRPMCFSGRCSCGSIPRRGTGWGGRDAVEGSMQSLIVTIFLSGALIVAGCGDSRTSTPAVTNAASIPPLPKAAAPVEAPDIGLIVSGPIIVEHQVEITAQRDGVLAKISYDAPARVKAGTVLARIDDRQIAANLEAARAKSRSIAADLKNWESEAEVLKADHVRAQRLWDLGLISEEQLQHAKYKAVS